MKALRRRRREAPVDCEFEVDKSWSRLFVRASAQFADQIDDSLGRLEKQGEIKQPRNNATHIQAFHRRRFMEAK